MTLQLERLDGRTRGLMLAEVDSDVRAGCLYMSSRLTPTGVLFAYLAALREAILHGSDQTLAAALTRGGLLKRREMRHAENGQPVVRPMPRDASKLLAEAEFNRFYLRALRVRAKQDGVGAMQIYGANDVGAETDESRATPLT